MGIAQADYILAGFNGSPSPTPVYSARLQKHVVCIAVTRAPGAPVIVYAVTYKNNKWSKNLVALTVEDMEILYGIKWKDPNLDEKSVPSDTYVQCVLGCIHDQPSTVADMKINPFKADTFFGRAPLMFARSIRMFCAMVQKLKQHTCSSTVLWCGLVVLTVVEDTPRVQFNETVAVIQALVKHIPKMFLTSRNFLEIFQDAVEDDMLALADMTI